MEDLIKALQIFLKCGNPSYPTNCSRDVLYVNIDPELASDTDKSELDKFGFFPNDDDGFSSFKFGSC